MMNKEQQHSQDEEQRPFRITSKELETFQKDGVILLKDVLTPSQVEFGRTAINGAISNPGPQAEFIYLESTWNDVQEQFQQPITKQEEETTNTTTTGTGSTETMTNGDKDVDATTTTTKTSKSTTDWLMFQDQFSTKRCPKMKEFLTISNVGQMAAELMQSKTATFFYDHVIAKRPRPTSSDGGPDQSSSSSSTSSLSDCIPWHQDLPYWRINGTQIVSVWIPFDVIPSTSSVKWALGTHRWGLFRPQHFVDATPYQGTEHLPSLPNMDDLIRTKQVTCHTFSCQPGDVLVFDARIIHCSDGNLTENSTNRNQNSHDNSNNNSNVHRRVAFRFGGDDAVYWERQGETAIPTPDIVHGLQHGDPLKCDAFPQVWPPVVAPTSSSS